MFGGAVVRRAVVLIAAVIWLVVPTQAQSQADAMVEKFAGEAESAKAKKADTARKADDAKAKKEAARKAAQANKSLEIRKDAEAQRAAAIARLKTDEMRALEEKEMLARAREEAEDAKATADIRRLIGEAEAARMRAEEMLAQEDQRAREQPARPARIGGDGDVRTPSEQTERQVREIEAELANRVAEEARQTARRAAESRDGRSKLARVRHHREARLAARQQAQEEAQRHRLAEEAAAAERARAAEVSRLAAQQQAQRQAQEEALRQRLAEEAAAAELARAAEVSRLAAQQQAQRQVQEEARRQRLAEEAAAAERARAVEASRLAAQQQAQEEAQRQRLAKEAADRVRAEEVRLALQASREEAERRVATEDRERSRRLADAPPPTASVAPRPPSEPPVSAPFAGRAGLGAGPNRRVAVLMIMTPGTYGIRRRAKTADPVLCAIDGCYISAGADRAAVFLPRRRALGLGNTLGVRAGACRQSLSCVFRGVELGFPGALQPVDLHILKHDGRRPQTITGDSDCNLVAGLLTCNRAIVAEDYVLWILPEQLATIAGADAIERALKDGLSTLSRSAEVAPQLPMQ